MGLSRKRQKLYALRPDIAVIPECSKKCLQLCTGDGFDGRWFGENPLKGLGVLVAKPWKIQRAGYPSNKWVVPISVSGGGFDFRLIAVWTMRVKGGAAKSYIGQLHEAVIRHPKWFGDKPVILCGDLNSNSIWDEKGRTTGHAAVIAALEQDGLTSSYHHFFSEAQGKETRSTHYFWHRESRGYHIDYIFLPKSWVSRINTVDVGTYGDWSAISDHVPICVDVNPQITSL